MAAQQKCDTEARRERWLVLVLVCTGSCMSTLDVSMVNVALPTLTRAFHTTVETSQWFVQAYTLAITMSLLTFGRLGDLVGRRRLYAAGAAIFAVGSLGCALSISAANLIGAKLFEGIGASVLMACGTALVTDAFPTNERGRAIGLVATAVALGLLVGPILGGVLVTHFHWRVIFFFNVPIGIALAAAVATLVSGFDTARDGRLDLLGSALLAGSLAALTTGVTYGAKLGWSSRWVLALFASTVILAAGFALRQLRAKHPLLNREVLKNREIRIGAFAAWANYTALFPVSVFLPFYLAKNFRPDRMGLILAAGPLTLAFVGPIAGTLSDRIGSRFLTTLGLVTAAVGLLAMRGLSVDSPWYDVVWRLVLANLGSALFVTPNTSAIMGSVACEDLGVASSLVALVRNLGMLSGVAAAGAIIATVRTTLLSRVPSEFGPMTEGLRQRIMPQAFLEGLAAALGVCAVICIIGAFVSALRVRPGDREAFERMG